jgi:hypothetical protein
MAISGQCTVAEWGSAKGRGARIRPSQLGRCLGCLLLWLAALGSWAQTPLLQLDLQGTVSSLADPTFIYVQTGATTGFDNDYDASKLPNPNGLNLASLTPAGQQLAISALPPGVFATPFTVDLFVGVPQDDQYTLTVSQLASFGFSTIYLVDALLQTRQLLAAGSTYSFALNGANTGGTYITTRFSLVFEPTGIAPLPVSLVAFAAQRHAADGLLTWVTASELHNAYFQVESSIDGAVFAALGRVAGAGTSSAAHTYQFRDANLARYAAPQVYYRLRQVDTDGTSTYSPVRALAVPRAPALAVVMVASPGQSASGLTLAISTSQPGPATWLLTDGLGRVVAQQELLLGASTTTQLPIELSGCAPGLYVLRVQQGQQRQTLKVVHQ